MAAIVLLVWLNAAQAGTQPVRILALGASITAGYGLDAADSLPVQLEAALRAHGVDATVINSGVSGDTSAGGLARLDWALADNPDLVILDLGGNDALRAIDPKTTEANLDAIVSRLKAEKRGVLIAGMLAASTLVTLAFYVFGTNWWWAVLTDGYWGFGYLVFDAIVFALFVDIIVFRGIVTNAIVGVIGAVVSPTPV